jgi:histidine phosphotransferase ChpT
MARGFLDDKVKLTWNMQRVLLPKNRVKLLLNMLVIAVGTLMVDAIGEGEATGFRITTSGLNARISQALLDLLAGSPENGTIDAHAVQPFYTGLLAKACNVAVTLAPEGDGVVVATKEPEVQAAS